MWQGVLQVREACPEAVSRVNMFVTPKGPREAGAAEVGVGIMVTSRGGMHSVPHEIDFYGGGIACLPSGWEGDGRGGAWYEETTVLVQRIQLMEAIGRTEHAIRIGSCEAVLSDEQVISLRGLLESGMTGGD